MGQLEGGGPEFFLSTALCVEDGVFGRKKERKIRKDSEGG